LVKFTLHDIFGYLFPGFVTLAAITIWASPDCLSEASIQQYENIIWPMLIIALVIAYILGTVVTSVAGTFLVLGPMKEVLPESLTGRLDGAVTRILCEGWDKESDKQRSHLLDRTCDEYVLQLERKDRYLTKTEMFFYRIDYCRGSVVAFLVLGLSTFLSLVLRYGVLGTSTIAVHLAILLVSAIAVVSFSERFKRFWRLRQYYIAINFLILHREKAQEKSHRRGPQGPTPKFSRWN